jgi:hypothetical protein
LIVEPDTFNSYKNLDFSIPSTKCMEDQQMEKLLATI